MKRREKLTARVSEELMRVVRIVAAAKGITVQDYVVGVLTRQAPVDLAALRCELNGRAEES